MGRIFSLLTLGILWLGNTTAVAWGPIGHYVIGKVAEDLMKKETLVKIEGILDNQSIAGVGVWMDQIRSDEKYKYTYTWHWVTTLEGEYNKEIQEKEGDAYEAFLRLRESLKKGGLTREEERDQLKMLIHIVGDLHQPFHVGKPGDRGGNDIRVTFFRKATNIHAVWDSDLLESRKMSYTELAGEYSKRINDQLVSDYQGASVLNWLTEAVALRPYMYDIPDDGKIGYEYLYKYVSLAEERLIAAGIRLAGILEDIYGK
jgi:hypothetical protein